MAKRQKKVGNTVISDEAREAFERLRMVEPCTVEWWACYPALHAALGMPPWQWPAVKPPDVVWQWEASAATQAAAERLWNALEAARR